MGRLVAFGCSNTYGEGLPDCWINDQYGPNPSKFAWPQLLADDLGLECINLGVPGTSNKQICNDILNTDFESTDTVVIMWTYFSRSCVFQDEGRSKRILIQDITNKYFGRPHQKYNATYYKRFYTETNSNIESHMYMNLSRSILNERGIKNYHANCNLSQGNLHITLPVPKWNLVDYADFNTDWLVDGALDNSHPGIKSQKNMSKGIKNFIKGESH